MKPPRLVTFLAFLAALLTGCSQRLAPTSLERADLDATFRSGVAAEATGDILLSGYLVHYAGRSYASGQTTFSYTVTGTGVDPALSNFTIQLPACAPTLASQAPGGGTIGTDPNSGLFGIKWNLSLGTSESRSYSITFPGDISEGFVRVAVKAGTLVGIGVQRGPCQGFLISGTVFVDQDSSGTLDATDEPGIIANVTVALEDANGAVETTLTDQAGRYSFIKLDGQYTVRIDAATAAPDFNEQLYDAFSATGPSTVSVTVASDVAGVDFGFKPKTKKIIDDFAAGTLVSTGEPTSFWTRAFKAALRGGSYGGFNAAGLQALLAQIEHVAFPDPYQFTDGSELLEALAILTSRSKLPLDVLTKQLFVAELNDVSGKGLISTPELQDVLISWGESLIIDRRSSVVETSELRDYRAGNRASDLDPYAVAPSTDAELVDAGSIFGLINNARGGGDVPQ